MQQVQPMEKPLQHKIERPQPQDGEDVRGVNDERVMRHAEHRRHGIDGEDYIGDLDGEHGEQRWRHAPAAPVNPLRDGWGHLAAFLLAHQTPRGIEQQRAEDVLHGLKAIEQCNAGHDEQCAQHNGAQHAVGKCAMLLAHA